MKWREKLRSPGRYLLMFFKWALLGAVMGAIGGVLGAAFHHSLHFVTGLRTAAPWLIFLLPLGGLATMAIYRLKPLRRNRGTNEIIDAVLDGRPVSPLVAPAMFVSTAITHLVGGSAGREGAALQIGGSVASLLGKGIRLKDNDRTVLIMSGMSAVFAGLFGTPLTACLFTMEFEAVGTVFTPALLPCFAAAFTAAQIAGLLGVHPEGVLLETMPFNVAVSWKIIVLAVAVAVLGIVMCYVFHKAEHLAKKWLKNPFLRIAAGGTLILGMTLLVGDHRFNGAGMDMALHAVEGHTDWYNFLLKMLFTALTIAAGFKGGEIVPTFCIGATFGCLLGGALGMAPGMAAALGLVGLFCCATNSPLASIVLSVEMFGGSNLGIFSLVCVVCFVLSGKTGLYASQLLRFSKTETQGLPHREE